MSGYLLVALGGALGAVSRYGVSFWISARAPGDFPYGTFIVNITGCLIMGIAMTRLNEGGEVSVTWRYLVPVGFIGGYTTFSSFAFETFRLIEQGASVLGLAYVGSSVILGYLALWLGVISARAFL